ncbi:enoyl-CoA hydratase/isomerase family protein [Rubrobacter aplysinae]|uniref:enoyl-CoA hydratase/isomerase family protein n=1 Tax=Rubrobacter aplysinae TaxID=909625 RepID=UPI00064BC7A9|nr:enoyl-CoA hydratase-related protein [Rubrobacter aplysinae]
MAGGYETISTAVDGGVATITIDRQEVRNALNGGVMRELRAALDEFRDDESVGLVVFTGAGEKAFVAGADISELRERTPLDALSSGLQRLFDEIEGYEKPTIAAVNGYALGGGCELAMACDIRIAAESAKFGQPEVNLSIIPGAGGTQRLSRLVGKGKATELILTGEAIDAEEAHRIGLVSKVVPQEELTSAVGEMASSILKKGPLAIRLAKIAVSRGAETDQDTGMLIERLAQAVLLDSEDKREGTSAFLEKREPDFRGR